MRPASPSSDQYCLPLRIVDGPGLPGAFLGGRPPRGVAPKPESGPLRFFGSVPLTVEPELCASLFVADLEQLLQARGRLNALGLLEVVIHPAAEEREVDPSPLSSPLSEHGLRLLEPASDRILGDEGEEVFRPGHKIGGRPHLIRVSAQLVDSIEACRAGGFSLAAQFDFPSGDDAAVTGDWPFADGMFALFGRPPFDRENWRWYWDF